MVLNILYRGGNDSDQTIHSNDGDKLFPGANEVIILSGDVVLEDTSNKNHLERPLVRKTPNSAAMLGYISGSETIYQGGNSGGQYRLETTM